MVYSGYTPPGTPPPVAPPAGQAWVEIMPGTWGTQQTGVSQSGGTIQNVPVPYIEPAPEGSYAYVVNADLPKDFTTPESQKSKILLNPDGTPFYGSGQVSGGFAGKITPQVLQKVAQDQAENQAIRDYDQAHADAVKSYYALNPVAKASIHANMWASTFGTEYIKTAIGWDKIGYDAGGQLVGGATATKQKLTDLVLMEMTKSRLIEQGKIPKQTLWQTFTETPGGIGLSGYGVGKVVGGVVSLIGRYSVKGVAASEMFARHPMATKVVGYGLGGVVVGSQTIPIITNQQLSIEDKKSQLGSVVIVDMIGFTAFGAGYAESSAQFKLPAKKPDITASLTKNDMWELRYGDESYTYEVAKAKALIRNDLSGRSATAEVVSIGRYYKTNQVNPAENMIFMESDQVIMATELVNPQKFGKLAFDKITTTSTGGKMTANIVDLSPTSYRFTGLWQPEYGSNIMSIGRGYSNPIISEPGFHLPVETNIFGGTRFAFKMRMSEPTQPMPTEFGEVRGDIALNQGYGIDVFSKRMLFDMQAIRETKIFGINVGGVKPDVFIGKGTEIFHRVPKPPIVEPDFKPSFVKPASDISPTADGGLQLTQLPKNIEIVKFNPNTRIGNVGMTAVQQATETLKASMGSPKVATQRLPVVDVKGMLGERSKQMQNTGLGLMRLNSQNVKMDTHTRFKELGMPATDTMRITDTLRTQMTIQETQMDTPVVPRIGIGYPPPTPPPFKEEFVPFVPVFGGFDFGFGRAKQLKSRGRKYKYTPSVMAIGLGIRGKQPKNSMFSGMEIRPMPKLKKGKKSKLGFGL